MSGPNCLQRLVGLGGGLPQLFRFQSPYFRDLTLDHVFLHAILLVISKFPFNSLKLGEKEACNKMADLPFYIVIQP